MDRAQLESQATFTTAEFAEVTRSDPRSVRGGIEAGQIPVIKFGRVVRIPGDWVRQQCGLRPLADLEST